MRRITQSMVVLSVMILLATLGLTPAVSAQDTPQRGGILKVALSGDPPSMDMHQESTFKVTIPMSTVYNTLIVVDPHGYPNVIGDLAKSWETSADGMTWTFHLHQGVKFHDGSELTSADAKASWDRIFNPSSETVSSRKTFYQMIKSVEAPEPYTVVFHLHYPAASFLTTIAHPANFIFAKKYLNRMALP